MIKFFYRLSYPIFWICVLFVTVVISPIKWLLTGDIKLNTYGFIVKTIENWYHKINDIK